MVKIRHMANTFRKVYKKTGNSGTSSDYQLVGNIGVNGVELDVMKGASSSAAGEIGLVPKPASGQENSLLVGDGTWKQLNDVTKIVNLVDTGEITQTELTYNVDCTGYKFILVILFRFSAPCMTQLIPDVLLFKFSRCILTLSEGVAIEVYFGETGQDVRIVSSKFDHYGIGVYGIK